MKVTGQNLDLDINIREKEIKSGPQYEYYDPSSKETHTQSVNPSVTLFTEVEEQKSNEMRKQAWINLNLILNILFENFIIGSEQYASRSCSSSNC